jgi:hypothetical protein
MGHNRSRSAGRSAGKMTGQMSNRQILLVAMMLGFIGGFSFVAAAQAGLGMFDTPAAETTLYPAD